MEVLCSTLSALCLCIGFYFGFKLGRTNELPKIKTKTQRVIEKKQDEEENRKVSQMNKILDNLSKYDGSSKGQEDIL